MKISVVIPTRNRPQHLRKLLKTLACQILQPAEIIIVDASDATPSLEIEFQNLPITIIRSIPSVSRQRNLGILQAANNWIFLCDDDLELPADYILKISNHINLYPYAGAVSGLVLQMHKGNWVSQYPITSILDLIFRFIFQLGIWGPIDVRGENFVVKRIKQFYREKGNHIARSGWPVITDFSGDYFKTPFYGLGASVIRKEWLMNSPYDEVLDPNGIGDNFGVSSGFPPEGIHVLSNTFVYHHRASENRLYRPEIYYRRILALDYFILNGMDLHHTSRIWFFWSLLGNMGQLLFQGNVDMIKAGLKLMGIMLLGKNPYMAAKKSGKTIINPTM